MSPCWQEILRTMGSLFCYLIIFQILCCTFVFSETQNGNAMRDDFVNSHNSVLQSVWKKEPSVICNAPKPPETSLESEIFLRFSFNQFLCVILYDISYRFANIPSVEHFDKDSEKLVQSIIDNSPPQNFCQKMKNVVWNTDIEENSKWFLKFNDVMKNPTLCNKYCVDDVVNPLCAYIFWLDSSIKVKLLENMPTLSNDHDSHVPIQHAVLGQQLYLQGDTKSLSSQFHVKHESSKTPVIPSIAHAQTSIAEAIDFKSDPTAVSNLGKSSTKVITSNDHFESYADLSTNQSTETDTGVQSSPASPGQHFEKSPVSQLTLHNPPSHSHLPKNLFHDPAPEVPVVSGLRKSKPSVLSLGEGRVVPPAKEIKPHISPGDEVNRIPLVDKSKLLSFLTSENTVKPNSVANNTAASSNGPENTADIGMKNVGQKLDESHLYTGKGVSSKITGDGYKNEHPGKERDSESIPKLASSKPEHTSSAMPVLKQTSSQAKVDKQEQNKPSGAKAPKSKLEFEDGNTADEGISEGVGVIEPEIHETPKGMDEPEGRDDVDSVAETPEDPSDIMDATSQTHFVEENPPLKHNTSPKISDYGDELPDEDPAIPMNGDGEKGALNDADVGIYVHDRFGDAEDSHFFAYFMTMIILCILGYLIFHNKQKILALALEGRVRKGNRRRPSTSGYRKLDSNLEEAVTSNCSGTSVTHVIY